MSPTEVDPHQIAAPRGSLGATARSIRSPRIRSPCILVALKTDTRHQVRQLRLHRTGMNLAADKATIVQRLTLAFRVDKASQQVCLHLHRRIITSTTRSTAILHLTILQEATAMAMRIAEMVTTVALLWEHLSIIPRALRMRQHLTAITCPRATTPINIRIAKAGPYNSMPKTGLVPSQRIEQATFQLTSPTS